jgi:hypothetical protein
MSVNDTHTLRTFSGRCDLNSLAELLCASGCGGPEQVTTAGAVFFNPILSRAIFKV